MANCHNLFQEYNQLIKLSDIKRGELITARDSLRLRMMEGYHLFNTQLEHNHSIDFQSQGSFIMDTIITPIHGDYDLDDGVYFMGALSRQKRPKPEIFHSYVMRAIDRGYDDVEKIIDKVTCVRVIYKSGFHVDLPIYYADNYENPDLANTESGWILSNPVEFIAWFEDKIQSGFQKSFLIENSMKNAFHTWSSDIRKNDVQLRKIVRYLKAWGNLRREEMPCGLIMTILAAENYYKHERDDIALKETLIQMQFQLKKEFKCLRPTTPTGEDLLQGYKNKDAFLRYLDTFIDNAKKALEEPNEKFACLHWQKSLGERFPCHLARDMAASNHATIGLTIGAATSRPWC